MKRDWCAIHHHVDFIFAEGEDGTKHPTCPHCWDYHIEKEEMGNLHLGTQIAYVPSHTNGDISHPDVEFGFVTARTARGYFCRYLEQGKRRRCSEN